MRPRRIGISLLGILLLLVVAAGGAYYYAQRLPNPSDADFDQLVRWMVTTDLRKESSQTKDDLLDGLERKILSPVRSADLQNQLSHQQQALLTSNADVLAERWFHRQVDQYFAQPEAARPDYLEKQIDRIQNSRLVQSLAVMAEAETASDPKQANDQSAIWRAIHQRAKSWIDRAEKFRKDRCQQFVMAVQQHLLKRWWRDSVNADTST